MSDVEPNADPHVVSAEVGALPDLAAVSVIEAELDEVSRALERLDEGTYGTCEVCGAALGDEVLAAEPAARRCGGHPA